MDTSNEKRTDKGFTLIECISVLAIMSILIGTLNLTNRMIEYTEFNVFLHQVERMINEGQQMANLTGASYSLYRSKDDLRLCKNARTVYCAKFPKNVSCVESETTIKNMTFKGKRLSKAGSIVFREMHLGHEAKITVRVATGKITVYKNTYKP